MDCDMFRQLMSDFCNKTVSYSSLCRIFRYFLCQQKGINITLIGNIDIILCPLLNLHIYEWSKQNFSRGKAATEQYIFLVLKNGQ